MEMSREEEERFVNLNMNREFPEACGFDPTQTMHIIRNQGGPIRSAGGDRTCGASRVQTFSHFVIFYWDDFDGPTKVRLRDEFGIDESQRPISFSLIKRK